MKNRLFRGMIWLLVLVMLVIHLPVPGTAPVRAAAAVEDIQDGVTLHCWNWSFANIEKNMSKIASAGYTAIQTSPIQQAKQKTAGYPVSDWWVFYQPASFSIDNTGNSALGNKAQFKSMCETAHQYGIKVIVDVVANHMGNGNSGSGLSGAIIPGLKNDASCWHDITKNTYDYSKRYDVTQWCMNGLPDLNPGSDKVQNYVLSFLKECIDAGADGFRFDAAKHIETPDDGRDNCASDFWPTVINGATSYASSSRGIDLYCYGELLDNPGGNLGIGSYTKYMRVTDNSWGNTVRNNVVGSKNAGAFSYGYHKDAPASKLVLWAESHDTYIDGSSYASTQEINKTWALAAARSDAMSLYLARPDNLYPQKLGTASNSGWANAEVAAVNKFHNAFVGQSEYVANQNGIAYVERGNSGVVLVNCSGSSATVNVTANVMANGTYIDQITGNTFTVSGGKIKGKIGSTGIAVVYNAETCGHESHDRNGICSDCSANVGHSYGSDDKCACGAVKPKGMTVYFTNSKNWKDVNIYSWYTDGDEITASWPGTPMEHVEGDLYAYTLPADAKNVIFNNGSTQTDDLTIPAGKNHYHYGSGSWSVYTPEPEVTEPLPTDPVVTEPEPTDPVVTQPKPTDPKPTDPAVIQPKPTDPKPTQPQATEPSGMIPTRPGSAIPTYPGTTEPAVTEPAETVPDVTEPIPTEPVATAPDGTEPDITQPGITEPTVTEPEVTIPDATEPDPSEPDATEPETGAPTETTARQEPEAPDNHSGALILWIAVGIAAVAVATALIWRKKNQ